jgi:hypothetical protein
MPAQPSVHTSAHSERRSLGGDFAPRQRVWLSRGLVALCLWRLEHILHHCNPLDLPLSNFLKEQIAAEEESAENLKRLDWSLHRSGDVEFSSKECDQLLSRLLPSAFIRPGEGLMDRDAALHFVEILEAERQSFFSRILDGLSDDLSGNRLKAELDRSSDRLRLVRTILLPPPQSSEPVSTHSTAEGRCTGAVDRRFWVMTVSGQVNRLRGLHRASYTVANAATLGAPTTDLWRPAVTDLLRDLAGAAGDAIRSDEPLAKRFVQEFADLRRDGTRNLEDILSVARVALAWLMGGHTRRSRLKSAMANEVAASTPGDDAPRPASGAPD